MMELENIVANTVYIKAKESGFDKDKGRSKKWKNILAFPHISECQYLRKTLDCSYSYVVEKQPIGKLLFRDYAVSIDKSRTLVQCLDDIDNLFVCKLEDRNKILKEIIEKYFTETSELYISFITDSLKEKILANYQVEDCFNNTEINANIQQVQREIHTNMQTNCFKDFLNSVYFDRYLQWKYLEKKKITKDTFRMYRVLGIGGFGEVCACQVRATGKLYACKKLNKKRMKKRRGEVMAYIEKIILQRVNSPFIVSLAYAFETKDSLCLVLTIMNGGDLRFHIHNLTNGDGFSENRAKFYAVEILLGLEHLHGLNIVYRDLKPCNILIDDIGHVRISDLGLATVIEPGKTVKGRYGTLGYMAPEVLRNESYSFSPDWFGFGCIIYEMINGIAPFRKRGNERVKRDEFDRRVCEEPEEYSSKFTEQTRSLCQALLAKMPSNRLGCFDCAPNSGSANVRKHEWFSQINWQRMEARLEDPPFKPDLHAVYAKDVLDIEQFSTVRGTKLTQKDENFYKKFCTGAVSIPWQQEMIETGCYEDLNEIFIPNTKDLVANLDPDRPYPLVKPKTNLISKILYRFRGSKTHEKPDEASLKSDEKNLNTCQGSPIATEESIIIARAESNYHPKIDYLNKYFEGEIGQNKPEKSQEKSKNLESILFICCSSKKNQQNF